MIDIIILIACILVSGFIGFSTGYNCGYNDSELYQIQKQIDEKRDKIKHDSSGY